MLRVDSDIGAKIAAIGAIVFFGGGGILALACSAVVAFRGPLLGSVASLRVDGAGITWTAGYRALARFGAGPKTRMVPWSNITDLHIADTYDNPIIQASLANRKANRYGSLLPEPPHVRYVGVSVCDIDALMTQYGALRPMARAFYEATGSLVAGPVVGLTVEQLLQTLEAYRRTAAATPSPN